MRLEITDNIKLDELEKSFVSKFIEALNQDERTSAHGEEVNYQALESAKYLLQHRELSPTLTLEQIVKGAMNMAIALQNSKYRIITPEGIAETRYQIYTERSHSWFVGYNEALSKLKAKDNLSKIWHIAIPVIVRASNSPLYITPCVPNTLKLYFDYMKILDNNFVPPEIPTGNTFDKLTEDQFLILNSVSTLSYLSLFAVKKHNLTIKDLPLDLKDKLQGLPGFNEDKEEFNFSCSSCVII
ncbi:hypothetical protein ACQUW5_08185 [Legionella sp. CNM-1927-20]|uniref:hypothetical protein n=1 Tax=Legionella sp. CNM-1927-20 TaxID=3422221 RepID=UPI00403A8A34